MGVARDGLGRSAGDVLGFLFRLGERRSLINKEAFVQ